MPNTKKMMSERRLFSEHKQMVVLYMTNIISQQVHTHGGHQEVLLCFSEPQKLN